MQNKPTVLCLTGWGQKFDSLENIFSESFFVRSFPYFDFDNYSNFVAEIKKLPNPDILVGWSLGGQLSVRLIEAKIFSPKLLILIAPPFQMIKDEKIQAGMSLKTYQEFHGNFVSAPDQTLKKFAILSAMNDKNAKEMAKTLEISDKNFSQLRFWLEELKRFSCFDLDFSLMPRTLFFQGAGDMIVHESQAQYFAERIANFRLEIFRNCGHAPHLNNLSLLQSLINEEVAKIF